MWRLQIPTDKRKSHKTEIIKIISTLYTVLFKGDNFKREFIINQDNIVKLLQYHKRTLPPIKTTSRFHKA